MSELKVNKVTPRSGTTVTIGDSGEHLALAGNIGLGGATPTTSGTGITFPATASPSTNANTLDDYEEGTWTPVITGSTTAGSHSSVSSLGLYTKIGRLVVAQCVFTGTSGTGSGNMQIGGLPFTSNSTSDSNTASAIQYNSGLDLPAGTNTAFWCVFNSQTSGPVRCNNDGASAFTAMPYPTDPEAVRVTLSYMID
jgi:hypothetical protein